MSVDQEALLTELHAEHCDALHAFFRAKVSDAATAQDLVQETFVRAWRSIELLHTFAPDRRAYWLFSVARRLTVDHYRRSGTRKRLREKIENWPDDKGESASPASGVERADEVARVQRAIESLPECQREVLVLSALGGLSSKQIGQRLGKPAGTVRYQLSLARRALADRLGIARGGEK